MKRLRAFIVIVAIAVAGCSNSSSSTLPGPSAAPATPIKHIVIMIQENRSFDNMFAGFPGADTAMEGPCSHTNWCKNGTAKLHSVTLESTDRLGLGTDLDHSHNGFETEYNKGQMNGFDSIRFGAAGTGVPAKLYPYAYVERSESKAYWDFAKQYGIADHMFLTDTAASFIGHLLMLSGTVALNSKESLTDEPDNQPWGCDAPSGTITPTIKINGQVDEFNGPFPCFSQWSTIADLLDAGGVSWKYYVYDFQGKDSDFSGDVWNAYDAIKKIRYGQDWKTHVSMPNTNIFSDIKNGTLAGASWVIPSLAESDHPASGCNHGPHWVTSVIDAIGKSKYWNSTAVVLVWDDWGGWFDSVSPAQINYTSLGFRVPMVVVSPYAKPHYISSTDYDFGSVTQFLETNFKLGSLGQTDATANSMEDMFDYTQMPTPFTSEPLPAERPCPNGAQTLQQIIDHDGGVPD